MKGNIFWFGEDFWELLDYIDGCCFDFMCFLKLYKFECLVFDVDVLEDFFKGGFGVIYDRRLLVKFFFLLLWYVEFFFGSVLLDIIDIIGCWVLVCW